MITGDLLGRLWYPIQRGGGGVGGGAEAVLSSPEASKNICHTNLKKRLTNVCKFFEQLMNSYSLPLYCAYAR